MSLSVLDYQQHFEQTFAQLHEQNRMLNMQLYELNAHYEQMCINNQHLYAQNCFLNNQIEILKSNATSIEMSSSFDMMEDDDMYNNSTENPAEITLNTPQQMGFALEELIHNGLSALDPLIRCFREQEIRDRFNDQSINGVDHWITFKDQHILIQDKWCIKPASQKEVSQYLSCVHRIQARIESGSNVFLIWAGKQQPSRNAIPVLNERKAQIIHCNISIQALARNVILYVAELFGLDPSSALLTVPKVKRIAEPTQVAPFSIQDGRKLVEKEA